MDAVVLALHGWGAHSGLIWPVAERLAPLGYHVFAPDLPGFGQSSIPPTAWDVNDYVKFVLAYMDANEIDQTFLIGHSFGGRLGLVLGAEHTDRIRKMALADSAGVPPRSSVVNRTRLGLYKGLRDTLYRVGAKGLADQLRQWYGNRYGSTDFKSAGALRETFVRVVNEDLLPYAARIACPTLLFWGDRDEDTPLWQGRLLEKTIPDAGLIIYPGAGHYSYLEHLGEFVSVVDYFFKQEAKS
jgi:pimeloyl-ACP methyl ester carboxylesterase